MSFKWNIDIDITFRILVGLALVIYGCTMAVISKDPSSYYGYMATGCVMVLVGSKAIKNIKTPWFSVGSNGDSCGGVVNDQETKTPKQ